ncbi:peptidoglycan editing factor PgeF [Piscinibacter sakaiensis]|nr:peptidoglycan editing factor PgeF [Piscinibacter sakaiensis]
MTSRDGAGGTPPFAGFNLGPGSGDDPARVAAHRARLAAVLPARPVWLRQVHGAAVVRLDDADLAPGAPVHSADAAITLRPGIACAVLTADCLPVLFATRPGVACAGVGAAHAGWRGLAAGVLEATVSSLCAACGCTPRELQAWLGAAIGPRAFEVGPDVLAAFGADGSPAVAARFRSRGAERPGRWLADLPGLAADRLQALGVGVVIDSARCTVEDAAAFYSYRRDGVTGRMAALVWMDPAR